MSSLFHERARIASLSRSRPSDDPELVAARQNLAALRLTKHITSEAVELRPEQRELIAELLLRAGGAA
jgi:hypothetical protein